MVEEQLNREGYLVISDADPVRIVTPASVLKSGHILLGDCIHELPSVDPGMEIERVLFLMGLHSTEVLPIYDKEVFTGVIVRKDLTDALYEMNLGLHESARRTSCELEKSRLNFMYLADTVPAVFFILNADLRVTYWGRFIARLSGVKGNVALGRHITEIIPPGSDRSRHEELFRQSLSTGCSSRTVYISNDVPYELLLYPLGKVGAVIAWRRAQEQVSACIGRVTENLHLRHICQILHDTVGQYITALSLRCAEVERRLLLGVPVDTGSLGGMQELCLSAGEALRGLIRGITVRTEDVSADKDCFDALCGEVENLFCVTVERKTGNAFLPADIWRRQHVTGFIREALTNAAKHSGVPVVKLSVERKNSTVRYCIEDCGKGFDLAAVKKGIGLDQMRFNADEIGAELYIVSSTKGTTVSMMLAL